MAAVSKHPLAPRLEYRGLSYRRRPGRVEEASVDGEGSGSSGPGRNGALAIALVRHKQCIPAAEESAELADSSARGHRNVLYAQASSLGERLGNKSTMAFESVGLVAHDAGGIFTGKVGCLGE